ncbi:MAG: ATP-binding cassette domain-containing protein, partial [Alphaproteobacteria bacterium]|nr:ATP-binding cassette domain-containing protein [Alphaproteobacteria bacterium]
MISFNNIKVCFNPGTPMESHALCGITLRIAEGEFVTVIGSNGAGKSTLLNALTGDINLQSGTLDVDGVNITKWSTARRASVVARVFQDPMVGTCSDLSIEENLALAYRRGQVRNLSKALDTRIREEFRTYIAMLKMGLEDRLKDPIGLLSGGQRQTISLLMAVMSPMKILVLDEHTAALDPKTAHFVIELTQKIVRERGLTVLMVTHSMHQALE